MFFYSIFQFDNFKFLRGYRNKSVNEALSPLLFVVLVFLLLFEQKRKVTKSTVGIVTLPRYHVDVNEFLSILMRAIQAILEVKKSPFSPFGQNLGSSSLSR